ncbi:MAG: YbjN domain-containing protein [Alphaproteobacteria bacterium]|nr:YbjN domain-containing protein [Alphaproteobacteria bacterium]
MTATLAAFESVHDNPIDAIEELANGNEWPFERSGESEINICVAGSWCDYTLSITMCDSSILHLTAAFDFRAPKPRRVELCVLLALVNERLALGHFQLGSADGSIHYRQSTPLGSATRLGSDQCGSMLNAALTACERFYPAFQFVLWGGKTAEEAVEAAILDCHGEA